MEGELRYPYLYRRAGGREGTGFFHFREIFERRPCRCSSLWDLVPALKCNIRVRNLIDRTRKMAVAARVTAEKKACGHHLADIEKGPPAIQRERPSSPLCHSRSRSSEAATRGCHPAEAAEMV